MGWCWWPNCNVTDCGWCDAAPLVWQLTSSNWANDQCDECDQLDGVFNLYHDTGCRWISDEFEVETCDDMVLQWILDLQLYPESWRIKLYDVTEEQVWLIKYKLRAAFDCLGTNTMDWDTSCHPDYEELCDFSTVSLVLAPA